MSSVTENQADRSAGAPARPEIQPEKIPLPKGGGSIEASTGSYSTDESSGTATLSIPLARSSGRDFEPDPALSYSSTGGNGPFGLGMSLSLGAVSRSTLFGLPRYDDSDLFALNGAMLVPTAQTTQVQDGIAYVVTAYAPRQQTEFARIERWCDPADGDCFWRVIDAANAISVYGLTAQARIADPGDPSRIFEWLIEVEYDDRGNAIAYQYLPEDDVGITPAIYEIGRGRPCQRYIGAIRYGAVQPVDRGTYGLGPVPAGPWHIEMVFDYGQYDPSPENAQPYLPTGTWAARPDPFSSYAAGFEVRTHRLCRNVLLFHRFDALGAQPVLTHVTRLTYDQRPAMCRLARVDSLGYSYDAGAEPAYAVAPLPPLELGYSTFDPLNGEFVPVTVEDGTPLPDFPTSSGYCFVDLDRIGAPGLLYADGSSTLFWPASPAGGPSQLAPARVLDGFPIERVAQSGGCRLLDVEGDGDLDLMITRGAQAGFYASRGPGRWAGFRPFGKFPTQLTAVGSTLADLSGTGRSDLVAAAALGLEYHRSLGGEGYSASAIHVGPPDLPPAIGAWPDQVVAFADPFGSGGMHLVRVADGSVECWPSLGYGVFGSKVTLANAPVFGPTFDARLVLLADIDGAGPADLIYLDGNDVVICMNQGGNSFADPVRLNLPVTVETPQQATVVDLGGTGTSHLVVTSPSVPPTSWSYAFNRSIKAYLLTDVDNNLGGTAHITYGSSTRHYLEDQRDGIAWATRLPFPIHVVDRVVHTDAISDSRTVISYRYRHGYYDGAERQFQGFGLVERCDAETFTDAVAVGAASPREAFAAAAEAAPPRLTRTWYELGAWGELGEVVAACYRAEWFAGDEQALDMPGPLLAWPDGVSPDAEEQRQARVAMHGLSVRVEIYGLDGSSEQELPYQVQQYRYRVDELVPRGSGPFAVFMVHACENITYDYERRPADPAIRHAFVLAIDPCNGEVQKDCNVAYARRGAPVESWLSAQYAEIVTCNLLDYIDIVSESANRLGILYQWREYQLHGLTAPGGGYYSLESIAQQVDQALAGTGGLSAGYLQWERFFYYGDDGKTPAPLGQAGARALLRTTLSAEFPAAHIASLFAGILDGAALEEVLSKAGGYRYDADNGMWWAPADVQSYYAADGFFLPQSVTLPFGACVAYAYDPTWFALVRTTESAPGVLDHVVEAEAFDYQALMPVKVTDPNRNTEEVVVDALGKVVLTSRYGHEMGEPVGFAPIVGAGWQAPPSIAALIAAPATYLGKAATVLAYDLLSWCGRLSMDDLTGLGSEAQAAWDALVGGGYISPEGAVLSAFRALAGAAGLILPAPLAGWREAIYAAVSACPHGIPAHWASVTAQVYPTAPAQPPMIAVEYCDGFGRGVQNKQLVPSGRAQSAGAREPVDAAQRWATSGAARYDSRGRVYMRYNPFFSDTWQYTDAPDLARQGVPSIYFYDALDRQVQVLTPKGFLRQAQFTPWCVTRWDEVDTVLASPYWHQHPGGQGLTPLDWQALQKAALAAGTPAAYHIDALGRVIASVALVNRVLAADAFVLLGLSITQSAQLFAALQALSFLNPLGGLTIAFQPGQPGFSLHLPAEFQPYETEVVAILAGLLNGGRPLVSRFGRDASGLLLWSVDPRLLAAWPPEGMGPLSFATDYSLTGRKLVVKGADNGVLHRIEDVTGHDAFVQDGRGVRMTTGFDGLHRIRTVTVADTSGTRVAEWYVYGDEVADATPIVADPYSYNLVDEVYRQFDGAGMRQIEGYSMGGTVMSSTQRMLAAPAGAVDWGTARPVPSSPLLAAESFAFGWAVDALNRCVMATDAAGNQVATSRNVCGQVAAVALTPAGSARIPIVVSADYNAFGQLQRLQRGNGLETVYAIDALDLRVVGIASTRTADGAVLQDIAYVYDPVGNISHSSDSAFAALWGTACGVDGSADFNYDALYRLIGASSPVKAGYAQALELEGGYDGLVVPMDGNAIAAGALEQATWTNAFDDGGNPYWTGMSTGTAAWANEMVVADLSNRSVSTTLFGGGEASATPPPERVVPAADLAPFFDANGNQIDTETTTAMGWDYRDKLVAATCADSSLVMNVDAQGDLVRRIETVPVAGGNLVTDTITLGDFELVRVTRPDSAPQDTIRTRARFNMHLAAEAIVVGSRVDLYHRMGDLALSVRMTTTAAGAVATAEAYTPFGATAFAVSLDQAAQDTAEERYDQMRRDRSTGFYEFPARWYAPWARRWLSPDPSGQRDGMNLYAFVAGNPASNTDSDGQVKIKLSDGTVIDFDYLQTIEALQQAVDLIRADVQSNPLTASGTARKMDEYTVQNEGDLLRLAFDPKLRGDPIDGKAVTSYAMKFGSMEFTEKRLGSEIGVHGTVVIKGSGMIGYDELTPTANPQDEARRLSHLFRVKQVPSGKDDNDGIVPVMAISESDRSEIGGVLGLIELQNIKYGLRTFDEAFVNGNDPYFIGAKKKGGAKALKFLDRKRRGTTVRKSQVMTRAQTAKIKNSLETFVGALHKRTGKISKFQGADSADVIKEIIRDHVLKKAGFGTLQAAREAARASLLATRQAKRAAVLAAARSK